MADALTIVLSILAAFAIDAWWDTRTGSRELASHVTAVAAEMRLNHETLGADIDRLQRAREAQRELLRHTGPTPPPLTADSLATLVGSSFDANPRMLATGALESLIASGQFAALGDQALQQALADWRSQYSAVQAQGDAFRDSRIRTLEAVGGLIPALDAARHIDPAFPKSSFAFRPSVALSDPRFEALFANLGALCARLVGESESLLERTAELVQVLGRTE